MSYKFFTEYYDEIVRGEGYSLKDEVDLIEEFIKRFGAGKDMLEFASGTGIVAAEFQKKGYDVFGVDLSESMLERARLNMGEKYCEYGDMTSIQLGKRFDVVLCNYNSICHLTSWKQWQDFFHNSYIHLKKGGLFIFDINTVSEFENITRDFAQFYNIGNDTICLEMNKNKGLYEWIVKMFIFNKDNIFNLEIEKIQELSFEIDTIKEELKTQGFQVIHLEDFHKGRVDDESERVYFVAKKND